MARKIIYGRGKAQVELSGGMRDAVDRVLSRPSIKAVADRLEEEARQLYEAAREQWPEKTGASKEALEYGLRIPDPTSLEAYVGFNMTEAPYVFYIRQKYPYNNRRVWIELLRKPMRRRVKVLAAELGDELRKAAGRS